MNIAFKVVNSLRAFSQVNQIGVKQRLFGDSKDLTYKYSQQYPNSLYNRYYSRLNLPLIKCNQIQTNIRFGIKKVNLNPKSKVNIPKTMRQIKRFKRKTNNLSAFNISEYELSRLLNFIKPGKWTLSSTICLLIVSGTVTIIVPLAIEKIIGIIYTSDYSYLKENIKSWCNVLMGALFTGGLFNLGLAYLTNIPELKHLMKSLRANKYTRMFSHLNLAQMLVLNDENFDINLEHIGNGTNAFAARRKIILVAKKLNELCSNLYDIVQNTINGEKLTSSIEENKVNNDDSSNLDEEEYNNKKFEFSSMSVKLFGKAFAQLFITGMSDDETASTMYKLLDKVIQSNQPETQQKEVSSDTRLQSGQHYRRKKLSQRRILTDTQVTQQTLTKSDNYPIPPVYNRHCIRELQSQAYRTKKINLKPIYKEFYCAEPWGKHVTENALEYARHSDFVGSYEF